MTLARVAFCALLVAAAIYALGCEGKPGPQFMVTPAATASRTWATCLSTDDQACVCCCQGTTPPTPGLFYRGERWLNDHPTTF